GYTSAQHDDADRAATVSVAQVDRVIDSVGVKVGAAPAEPNRVPTSPPSCFGVILANSKVHESSHLVINSTRVPERLQSWMRITDHASELVVIELLGGSAARNIYNHSNSS